MGGFVAAAQPVVDLLRQRARPYLFSNALAPPVAAGALVALEIVRPRTIFGRCSSTMRGACAPGSKRRAFPALARRTPDHSGDAGRRAARPGLAGELFERGVYVAGFFFPVVPKGAARIRTQMTARADARGPRLRARGLHGRGEGGRERLNPDHNESAGQAEARARPLDERRAGPLDRSGRRADPHPQDRHLRHRPSHLELGRMGAEDDPDADDIGHEYCRRDRRVGPTCPTLRSASAVPARGT